MPQSPQLRELTAHELGSVQGGFLPLLGLIGMGTNLAGQIMGGIGKKKAEQAQQLNAETAAKTGAGASPGATPAPASSGNLLAQPAQASSSCCDCA